MILSQTTQAQTALIAANLDEGQNGRKIAKDNSFMDAWSEQGERSPDEDMKASEAENSNLKLKTESETEVENSDLNTVPHSDTQKLENKKPEEFGVDFRKDSLPEAEAITVENFQVDDVQAKDINVEPLVKPAQHTAAGPQEARPIEPPIEHLPADKNIHQFGEGREQKTAVIKPQDQIHFGAAKENNTAHTWTPNHHPQTNDLRQKDAKLDSSSLVSDKPPLPGNLSAHSTGMTAMPLPINTGGTMASFIGSSNLQMLSSVETSVLADHGESPKLYDESHEIGLTQPVATSSFGSLLQGVGQIKTAHPTLVQQIAAALQQSSGQSTQIALNPEELGRVRISLSSNELGLVVNIVAERPETADLMRRNIDSLLQDFSELGYDNPTFDFQNDDGNNGGDETADTDAKPSDGTSANVFLSTTPLPMSRTMPIGGLDLKL